MTPPGDFLATVVGVFLGTWLYRAWRDAGSRQESSASNRAHVSETPDEDPRRTDQ